MTDQPSCDTVISLECIFSAVVFQWFSSQNYQTYRSYFSTVLDKYCYILLYRAVIYVQTGPTRLFSRYKPMLCWLTALIAEIMNKLASSYQCFSPIQMCLYWITGSGQVNFEWIHDLWDQLWPKSTSMLHGVCGHFEERILLQYRVWSKHNAARSPIQVSTISPYSHCWLYGRPLSSAEWRCAVVMLWWRSQSGFALWAACSDWLRC